MATTNENSSMNIISMETQSTPYHPGNNPAWVLGRSISILMLVAGLSCMMARIMKLVQYGRQNQEENSENATISGYEIARQVMIGLSFATAGFFFIWLAYRLELVILITLSMSLLNN